MTAAAASSTGPGKLSREVWLITIGHGLTHWYPATFYLLLVSLGTLRLGGQAANKADGIDSDDESRSMAEYFRGLRVLSTRFGR